MVKKRIILTKHVQERMLKRGVTRENITDTIDNPTKTLPIAGDNTQEFRRNVNSKEHYVVVRHGNNKEIVITTGWS